MHKQHGFTPELLLVSKRVGPLWETGVKKFDCKFIQHSRMKY